MDEIKKLRKANPVVLNIANMVTPQHVADAINFIGASPIMFNDKREAKDLVNISDALVINLGSNSKVTIDQAIFAGKEANHKKIPIVLDPVAIAASKLRQDNFKYINDNIKINVLRGNAGEIAFIAGVEWDAKGIDAGNGKGSLQSIAEKAARKLNAIVVLSGPSDIVTDGETTYEIDNGNHFFALNVGCGDMLDGIIGAFMGIESSISSVVMATKLFSIVGEIAAAKINEPYMFLGSFFDNLYKVSDQEVAKKEKVKLMKN
ncbi:hydroxyethylthiazole kinase [Apilactobacillus quenuiae]|uniref:hydroxyethylthiazole kinase n=1 Tax=Apilactobacillus quenuiae TaxID=2008377 RepID=UPI000D019370|nr:hydroxyethylthiazole kinase [Apilactobacillus quenuiae]